MIRLKETLPNILKENGITVKEFAKVLQITPQTYNTYLNRAITLDTLEKISISLNVPIQRLLGIDQETPEESHQIGISCKCPKCGEDIKITLH